MKSVLPLFVFIDACGWEIIRDRPFLRQVAPYRRRLDSVFGYSSACVPSIVGGAWPAEHRNWCYFVYDPAHSPFKFLRPLRWLPTALTSRRIFRRWLSKLVKIRLRFKGYFDLYNIPFRHISLYDFTEKRSPLKAGGLNRGANVFDFLEGHQVAYHASDPERPEKENFAALVGEVERGEIDFAFAYWPELDGLLHRVGNQSREIAGKLDLYEQWLNRVVAAARTRYQELRLYVFSDHGMANCDEFLDLKGRLEALPVRLAQDYAVVYDSTMARFWFFNNQARQQIVRCLQGVRQGRILTDGELEKLGTLFADRYFGELIFLAREGVLIVPSHMGERPLRAMHGYHPDEPHSFAALLSNQPGVSAEVRAIPHLFGLMVREAQEAVARNHHSTGRLGPGPVEAAGGLDRDAESHSEPALAPLSVAS